MDMGDNKGLFMLGYCQFNVNVINEKFNSYV